MTTGLRERKRLATKHSIQEKALDLFDERGFAAVTIEEIAEAAEVSPSSVYRYFGTKEQLIVADDFADLSQEALDHILDPHDPLGTARRIVADYESTPAGVNAAEGAGKSPWRRVHYFFQEPTVRLAVYASLDEASSRIAASLLSRQGMSEAKARVAAHAFVFGYFAALEQWHVDGGKRPIVDYVDDGMAVLREIWTNPDR
ncbi:TetR family transcriptional regulator [Cryobacterium suzukii]|uniref:TetR family transcriptional regulator n=1 Tax=Cryobacterium suzukii TaxID=1259198 RepID=A0A4R9AIJ5_9MICO|nr:TetR family transcriptional regulator [Cryobacterium suzukii]TFD61707.1 TetR family transcriptional regulator [Cryobacterium suzukii]